MGGARVRRSIDRALSHGVIMSGGSERISAMAIQVQCTNCAREFEVRDDLEGKQVKCPCGSAIAVPAKSALVNLLDDELDIKVNPVVCTTPQEWAKAAGASPEVVDSLKKRMSIGAKGNANFMLGLTAAIAVLHADRRPGGVVLRSVGPGASRERRCVVIVHPAQPCRPQRDHTRCSP